MTAINNLIKKADELNRNSLKNLDITVSEIADAQSTIQTLIDIVLDLQHQLSDLIVLHIAFELPAEEEKAETLEKRDLEPHTHEIYDYIINIGPVNIYSITGAPADTFREFEIQTASVADIFTPFPFIDGIQAELPPYIGAEEPEKQVFTSDRTSFFETENLYSELKASALMIKELETISDRMAAISIEKRNIPISPGIPETVSDTLVLPTYELKTLSGSRILEDIEAFSEYVNLFSEITEDISTAIQTEILEAKEETEISSLENVLMETLSAADLLRTSHTITTEILEAKEKTEISSLENASIEALSSADLSKSLTEISTIRDTSMKVSAIGSVKGETHPEKIPGQRMIEIPAFMPREEIPTPEAESAFNAAALSAVMDRDFHLSFSREVQTPSSTEIHMVQPSSSSVSSAFETISDYITIASTLNNQLSEMMGEEVEPIFTPVDLLTAQEDTATALTLDRTVLGGDLAGVEPNIGLSISTTQSLLQEGAAAINEIMLAVPPHTTEYSGFPAATIPRAMENVMAIFGSPKETSSAVSKESRNHFQNTFNIAINMKGGGEEQELRELGRKIGTILSEEIKRYGVIR